MMAKEDLIKELELICESDPYGLSPYTLYNNIAGSLIGTKNPHTVSKIMEVPINLILNIALIEKIEIGGTNELYRKKDS